MGNFRHPLRFILPHLCRVHRLSPWMTRPVLSMTKPTLPLGLTILLRLVFTVLFLQDRVLWSWSFSPKLIRLNMDIKKPSVRLNWSLNKSRKVSDFSMARFEYSMGLPIPWPRSLFQDCITSSESHKVRSLLWSIIKVMLKKLAKLKIEDASIEYRRQIQFKKD